MTEDFKVSITGDIAGLKKAVGEAEKELSAFASKSRELKTAIAENTAISRGYDQAINELKKSFKSGAISQSQFKEGLNALKRDEKETTIETARLRLELINLNREQAGLTKITPALTGATKGLSKTSSNATNTMMEFSRVVQDAPYGIRGVANNIQQLVGNFGYLSKASGGASNAFKAMASSLMGPAGILLAVSLVTSLLVQYGDALLKSISGTEDAKVANDRLNDALREQLGLRKLLKDEIDVATRIAVAEAKLAGKNEQQQYDVKKKFSEANIAILESEYKEATKRYRAFHNKNMNLKSRGEDEITELVDESRKGQLEIQKELNDAKAQLYLDDLTEQIRVKEKANKENSKLEQRKGIGEFDANLYNKLQEADRKGYDKRQEVLNDFLSEKEKAEIDSADELMNVTFQKQTERLRLEAQGNTNEIALYDKYIDLKKDQILSFEQWKKTIEGQGYATSIAKTQSFINDIKKSIPKDIWGNLTVPKDFFAFLNDMTEVELKKFDTSLQKALTGAQIFSDSVGSSIGALTSSLSNSLKTDSDIVNAFVGSIINSMGQLLTMLITNAIANMAIKEAVASANVVTAATETGVAAGPAAAFVIPGLIAAGLALIAGTFASIGGFAQGGIVPGGSFNGDKVPAYVNSGEMILNGRQQGNLFDILDGNLRRLSAPAQNAMVQVSGELRGSTILLANARAEKNNSRFYGRK